MNCWINGRRTTRVDHRDRGLQYGDGVFETMRVRGSRVRLLEHHLQRLETGCRRLTIAVPDLAALRRELAARAAQRADGVLKLIVTRGVGARGYRPSGDERTLRIISLHPLPDIATGVPGPVRVRLCATPVGANPALAGIKTLNRLESVMARGEWRDPRIWEGLMCDLEGNIVCGTMSNLFMRRGSFLMTPMLERCGIAGVMRRWVLAQARSLDLRPLEGRIRWEDLRGADEAFLTNAIAGVVPIGRIVHGRQRIAFGAAPIGRRLHGLLDRL